jgi:hypothetical protein
MADPVCAEWLIQNVYFKLKVSSGYALISPPLELGDLPGVRLHFSPGEGWAASAPGRRCKKLAAKVDGRSAKCSISLKIGDIGCSRVLKFKVFIGNLQQGPFECSFAEKVVQDFELDLDWHKHLEAGSNLHLRLELLE